MKKDHRRNRDDVVWSRFFWCTILIVLSCVLFTGFTFSSFRFLFFPPPERLQPEIVPRWPMEAVDAAGGGGHSPRKLDEKEKVSIRETVILPDQVLLFLNHPPSSSASAAVGSARLLTRDDLDCVYYFSSPTAKKKNATRQPNGVDGEIVRCPLLDGAAVVSLSVKSTDSGGGEVLPARPARAWNALAYEALIDRDNTTLVFVKGLNLRPDKLYDVSRFECVYGWDFTRPKFILRSKVISIAQEIARCRTPLSLLTNPFNSSIKVSLRVKGRGTLHSVARPRPRPNPEPLEPQTGPKPHQLCICTMLRNQAKFIREWVMYHGEIGVSRWFVYDNNSEDEIESAIGSLTASGFNITRHVWPWVKTQEAGFAHCALLARPVCEWVGFIDVDEFLHLPSTHPLHEFLTNLTERTASKIGEVRIACHSFGPSGLTRPPTRGVIAGYTCRLFAPERHKSIVRPEALNSSLINVVHHFHLREGFGFVDADRATVVINHYKYQVWGVFKEKFYRRVATYVADWQDEQNVGSKDRTPGLGTRAVEPADWSSRFCEVNDTGLRDVVVRRFSDPLTNVLPWEDEAETMRQVVKRGGEFW